MGKKGNKSPLTAQQKQLAADNMGLVFKLLRDAYQNYPSLTESDRDELLGHLYEALVRAARGYKDLGYKFSTYATKALKRETWYYLSKRNRRRRRIPLVDAPIEEMQIATTESSADNPIITWSELDKIFRRAELSDHQANCLRLRFKEGKTLWQIGRIQRRCPWGITLAIRAALEKIRAVW